MKQRTFFRDSWIEIELEHIAYNVRQLKTRLSKNTKIYAVVKANGYGHGDKEVAKKAMEAGASGLAVAILDEAIKLRHAGITVPILVMGWIRPEDAGIAASYDVTVTFFQKEWLKEVKEVLGTNHLKLHMKWDTGMGRVGLRTEQELFEILDELDDERFELDGIFTHFATADEKDESYFQKQLKHFNRLMQAFESRWGKSDVKVHTGNSAASMRFPEHMRHYVRFGISMYGLYPSPHVKKEKPIDLKPALSLYSRLTHVKRLPPGESISYGATYTTEEEEWIGTIPLGYADGIQRKLQGSNVMIEGKLMPIVGRICMDQLMVRLDSPYPVGTKVTLIGKQNNTEVSMDDWAEKLDTINYEISCMLSYRIPRLYFENGLKIE
ncbi:alanine racemase [Aquibacillus albus]|uniref:Alanine racemase n=1 Tax=Aquibacillus albus TaxID=1168171 RepID=A0ABS2MZ15_9BACI|nr:alanine racemase [Aquibacillus albus]MBM7571081.1 alanine racemase [Aquibacillus albus]